MSLLCLAAKECRRYEKPAGAGDTSTWTAIEADTKPIISHFVGDRIQLTSDGHKAYLDAVEGAFGADIDYAMLIKIYGASPEKYLGDARAPSPMIASAVTCLSAHGLDGLRNAPMSLIKLGRCRVSASAER